ncbi:hypothetical protein [Methylobacter svalbardensis]|uniref:hypothetical protein n=1 Tax=Methylobacter svalbardensis TaxID=3080016 RepID=UPI0030EE3C35
MSILPFFDGVASEIHRRQRHNNPCSAKEKCSVPPIMKWSKTRITVIEGDFIMISIKQQLKIPPGTQKPTRTRNCTGVQTQWLAMTNAMILRATKGSLGQKENNIAFDII